MVKKKVTVKSKAGLHLRPARDLCKKAMEFESTQIMIHFREKEFNAKSMLGILSACVQQMDEDGRQFAAHAHGSRLAVVCEHLIYSRQIWKRIRKMKKE